MQVPAFLFSKKWLVSGLIAFVLLGIGMRFYQIAASDFILYDEGHYLNVNRPFYELVVRFYPENWHDMREVLWQWITRSLGQGKALWFMLSDIRVFWGMYHEWYIPRIMAAVAGTLTLGVVYVFTKRLYDSPWIGGLSAALLAVMPSHVFYSRLAMQETFCTLCFMAGFYFYLFPRSLGPRTFLSGSLLAAAYFLNYRLIFLPIHVALVEGVISLAQKRRPDVRKYMWHTLIFLSWMFLIGNLDEGQNTVVTFAWMFHQSGLAQAQWDWMNMLSYPYYLFRLENLFFAVLFLLNVYFVIRRQWTKTLAFLVVILHMGIFSFASDKAARYLCVVTPFMAMAVAGILGTFSCRPPQRPWLCRGAVILTVLTLVGMAGKSVQLVQFPSGYRTVMTALLDKDPQLKAVATQNHILNLFVADRERIKPSPYQFYSLLEYYTQGYRYLILDPQAYVSFTEDGQHFNPQLMSYLGFIVEHFVPMMTSDNFNESLLERFVFEHNENLRRTVAFLKQNDGTFGQIKVYDLSLCLAVIDRLIGIKTILQAEGR
jgi:hypothetical protein